MSRVARAVEAHNQSPIQLTIVQLLRENLKKRVLDLFNKHLKPGGFIIIGYYDILPDHGKTLFKTYDVKTRIYQKK